MDRPRRNEVHRVLWPCWEDTRQLWNLYQFCTRVVGMGGRDESSPHAVEKRTTHEPTGLARIMPPYSVPRTSVRSRRMLQNEEEEQDVSCATSAPETNPWSRLKCRLSSKRSGCCAVAVHDRFIVVMGGDKNKKEHLSSSINGYHGYSCAHCDCGTSHDGCSVWCHQCSLWALHFCGGRAPPNRGTHESVECFEFGTVWDHPTINDDDTGAAWQVFPSPCVVLGPFRKVWSDPSISWSVVAVGLSP